MQFDRLCKFTVLKMMTMNAIHPHKIAPTSENLPKLQKLYRDRGRPHLHFICRNLRFNRVM